MTLDKNNLFKYLLVALLCLFDFYKWGFRIFDVICYAALLFFIAPTCKNIKINSSQVVVILLALFYAALGLSFGGYVPTVVAMLINVLLFFLFGSDELLMESKHIKFALLLNVIFFYFQLFAYYGAGQIINFHEFTDIEPRLMSSIFRPAGLYYEPAIYCLSVFMLLMINPSRQPKPGIVEVCAIISLVLSVSFLGFFFAALVMVRLLKEKQYILPLSAIMLFIFLYEYIDDSFVNFVFGRLFDIDSDASASERYGNLLMTLSYPALIETTFGAGFGADFDKYGSSAISVAISSVGLVGVVMFVLWLLKSTRDRFTTILAMVGIFISAPVFTYAIFPFWIACLVAGRGRR